MAPFTDTLRKSTHSSHQMVDKHEFVTLIRTDKCSGKIYVHFNQVCINVIQNTLKNTNNPNRNQTFKSSTFLGKSASFL